MWLSLSSGKREPVSSRMRDSASDTSSDLTVGLDNVISILTAGIKATNAAVDVRSLAEVLIENPYIKGLGFEEMSQEGTALFSSGRVRIHSTGSSLNRDSAGAMIGTVGIERTGQEFGSVFCLMNSIPKSVKGVEILLDYLRGSLSDSAEHKHTLSSAIPRVAQVDAMKLGRFPGMDVQASLESCIKEQRLSLTNDQTVEIVKQLVAHLNKVSDSLAEALCKRLSPFIRDKFRRGESLHVRAYNFATRIAPTNGSLYEWAKEQYPPLLAVLSAARPGQLRSLVDAVKRQPSDPKAIFKSVAEVLKCGAPIVEFIIDKQPTAKQLAMVTLPGRNSSLSGDPESFEHRDIGKRTRRALFGPSDEQKQRYIGLFDNRPLIERFIALYGNLDNVGVNKLGNIFQAAQENRLSDRQLAFLALCKGSDQVVEQTNVYNIIPRLLHQLDDGLEQPRESCEQSIRRVQEELSALTYEVVFPRMIISKFSKGQDDCVNVYRSTLLEELMTSCGVDGIDYLALARHFGQIDQTSGGIWNRDKVTEALEVLPSGLVLLERARLTAYAMAILGGLQIDHTGDDVQGNKWPSGVAYSPSKDRRAVDAAGYLPSLKPIRIHDYVADHCVIRCPRWSSLSDSGSEMGSDYDDDNGRSILGTLLHKLQQADNVVQMGEYFKDIPRAQPGQLVLEVMDRVSGQRVMVLVFDATYRGNSLSLEQNHGLSREFLGGEQLPRSDEERLNRFDQIKLEVADFVKEISGDGSRDLLQNQVNHPVDILENQVSSSINRHCTGYGFNFESSHAAINAVKKAESRLTATFPWLSNTEERTRLLSETTKIVC